jgi:hypothetical protein
LAKRAAKKKGGKKKAAKRRPRRTGEPGPIKMKRAGLAKWLAHLDPKQLDKLAALKVIVEDPCTCERIPDPPIRSECEWTVKWENSGA